MRGLRIAGAVLGLILAAVPVRPVEIPYQLANIDRTPGSGTTVFSKAGSSNFFQLGDRLLFSTSFPPDNGILWSTDGTPEGTVQLSSSLCAAGCGGMKLLGTWHGLVILSVEVNYDGISYEQRLARTDGTPEGTFLLSPGIANDDPTAPLRNIQGLPDSPFFYFVGCGLYTGCHLWRSDGSVAGTQILKGTDGFSFDYPEQPVFWRGRLWFVAGHGPDEEYRFGLWSTDGTAEGTVFLHEVVEDGNDGARVEATPDHLFFSTGDNGEDLWVTDGTPEGTRHLADFEPDYCHPSCSSQYVNTMQAFGDELYFMMRLPGQNLKIWRSDGTVSGTGPRVELPPEAGWPSDLMKIGDSWIFTGYTSADDKYSFWTVDSGFTHAAPLSGCEGGTCPHVRYLTRLGPQAVFFQGEDPDHGIEPWVTDGTGPGTRRLADICPGSCSGLYTFTFGSEISVSPSGEAWFQAVPKGGNNQEDELWATDGTPAGTHRVWGHYAEVGFLDGRAFFETRRTRIGAIELWSLDSPSAAPRRVKVLRRFAPGSDPEIRPVRGGVVLSVYEGDGRLGLWKSGGTPERTGPIFEFPGDARYNSGFFLGPAGRFQFLRTFRWENDTSGTYEIWRTDGSREGTAKVLDLRQGEYIPLWTSWNGKSLFAIWSATTCWLWNSDGTGPGTREIRLLPPGVGCPEALMGFGSRFLFVARTADTLGHGVQVFISDGTPAGTHRITHLGRFREADDFGQFVQAGGRIFFRLFRNDNSDYGLELWSTDGTVEGTGHVFPALTDPDGLTVFHGSLYFTAQIPDDYNRGLYRAPIGGGDPVLLAKVGSASFYESPPAELTPAGDRLVFIGEDEAHGFEPWVTDGTPEGTHILADLLPGPDSSYPSGFAGGGGRGFFAARDLSHGEELWETDGTAVGTHRVQDIAPGGFSSSPRNLTVSNGFLFFAADDGKTGPEPWALKLP